MYCVAIASNIKRKKMAVVGFIGNIGGPPNNGRWKSTSVLTLWTHEGKKAQRERSSKTSRQNSPQLLLRQTNNLLIKSAKICATESAPSKSVPASSVRFYSAKVRGSGTVT